MSTLRDIRRRIQSVENIKQITKSMEMVAAARLHKAVPKREHSPLYSHKIRLILENLVDSAPDVPHPLLLSGKGQKHCLIVVAGDTGLCGPYNSNVFSAADKQLRDLNPDAVDLVLFGKKAIEHYRHRPWRIAQQIENWGGRISFRKILNFNRALIASFLKSEFHTVSCVYTHYVNTFSRTVVAETLLPIPKSERKSQKAQGYIFEPNPPELLSEVLPRYNLAKLLAILDDAYTSELAARVASMRSATKNAEDMIDSLILKRNKVRQAGITKEMLEITSSAEAMK
jgi:F-type H+-transporting ATPase subunit gamma